MQTVSSWQSTVPLPEATNLSWSLSVILSAVPSCSSTEFAKTLPSRKEENYPGRVVTFREIKRRLFPSVL